MSSFSSVKLELSLAPFVLALPLAMDIYVPAIPGLTQIFNISDKIMLLTLSIFMLTAGLMQLIIGPLSDSFGRKKIAYIVTLLFSLGCALCSISTGYKFLIFGRIIQAIGSCGMMVIGLTMVRDCFEGDKSAKVYSFLNGIIAFSPMFAPFIGSYIDIYFGWQITFLSLLTITLCAFISLKFFLPETLPATKRTTFAFREILPRYKTISSNRIFAIYNLASCFGLSYLYLFCALSPYLIIRGLHIAESAYGFYFFYMGLSFFIGSVACSQVVERFSVYNTCILGFLITLVGGIWMTAWYLYVGLTLNGFIYPMLLIGIGGTFCMGAGTGGLMGPFGKNTGAAAALSGSLRFIFSSITGMVVIHEDVSSTIPLGLPAILFSLIGLGLFAMNKRKLTLIAPELPESITIEPNPVFYESD